VRAEVTIRAAEVVPGPALVRRVLGYTEKANPPEPTASLIEQACEVLRLQVEPRGLWQEVSTQEFADLYRGEGRNEPRTPLEAIAPRAEHLALFAVTLGSKVSREITRLSDAREHALAVILDAAASETADRAADCLQDRYTQSLAERGRLKEGTRILRYSPGYCGWHLSGQKALFAALGPDVMGIQVRSDSYLMDPLKSISGIFVAGPSEIHRFRNDFPFCADCRDQSCRARMRGLGEGR
jgi:hypothetical protein